MGLFLVLLYDIHIWFPVAVLSAPVIYAIIYHNGGHGWYLRRKEKKSQEAWDRLSRFFAKHESAYPDAMASFKRAKFWASDEGGKLMHSIKESEFRKM